MHLEAIPSLGTHQLLPFARSVGPLRVARVESVEHPIDNAVVLDGFLRSILDATSQYERALIRSRTKAALAAKKARGEWAGTVPFGFRADDAGRLHPEPAEQLVVSQVREARAAGRSIREIVREAHRLGLTSRSERPLLKTTVERILTRTAA